MSSKLKFVLPAVFLVFCLIVFIGFASGTLDIIPDSLSIDQTNVSGMNEVRETTFNINNPELFNIVIVNVTDSGNLIHKTDGNHIMALSYNLNNGTTINAGSLSDTYDVNIVVDSTLASLEGEYLGWIWINATDEITGETEIKEYNLSVTANLVDTVNVIILNATNLADSDVIQPEDAMKINVNTTYWNGDFIAGLDETNFTAHITHVYESELSDTNDNAPLNITGYVENLDSYTLTAEALPETLLGGDYSITVSLTHPDFTGSDTNTNEFAIDQTALKLEFGACANSVYKGNKTTCYFKITNYGYMSASDVVMNYTSGTCISRNPENDLVNSSFESGYYNDTIYTNLTGVTVASCSLTALANSSGNEKWDVQTLSKSFTVSTDTTDDSSSDDSSSDDSSSSPSSTPSDVPSSSFSHKLEVTGPDTFTLVQGKSSTKTINVKNTGSFTEVDVKLSISGIPSSWYMIETEEQNVIIALSKEYKVQIKAPKDAEPKLYTIKFKAANSQTEGSASTTLKVMPSEDTKVDIAANYVNYSSWFDTMMKAYNGTSLSEENATEVESLLNQITGLLTKADAHIGLGEYFEAYNSLSEVRTLLMEAEDILGVQGSGMEFLMEERLIIVAVLVAFVAIGAGLYFATKSGKINLKMPNMPGRSRRSFGGKSDVTLKLKQKHAGIKLKAEEMRKNLKKKKDRLKQGNFSFKLRGQGE